MTLMEHATTFPADGPTSAGQPPAPTPPGPPTIPAVTTVRAPAEEPARDRVADALTAALALRREWMDDAACHGRTQLFFGIAGERPERRVRREARARKVCASCPVLEPCREMARTNGENGFWGGESEEERAAAGWAPVSISRRSVQEAAAGRLRAG